MKEISFDYKGRQHSGQIISSTHLEPHYYWVYFNDTEVEKIIKDDCLGFKKTNSGLQPTNIYTTDTDLVEHLRSIVEKNIM